MDFEEETEERSRADALIDEVKSSVRPGQFRLARLFGLTLLCAALLAFPRLVGWRYDQFFGLLYFLLYGCAPLAVWTAAWLVPRRFRIFRVVLATLLAAGIVLPIWILMASDRGDFFVQHLFIVFAFIWLPQVLCIGLVQYVLFRGAIKKRQRD